LSALTTRKAALGNACDHVFTLAIRCHTFYTHPVGAKGWPRTLARLTVGLLAALLGAGVAIVIRGSSSSAEGTGVRFLSPFTPQQDGFTPSVVVVGHTTVHWSGPFGGTGSNHVCNRELLIRYLLAHRDRMRAWAQVQAIAPTPASVAALVRSLTPATLVRDTRVTDWSYANRAAYSFEAILQAGTAVLVDAAGNIRARCLCGNPITYAILYPVEHCEGCAVGYKLPISGGAYVKYPDPPPVKIIAPSHPTQPPIGPPAKPKKHHHPRPPPPHTVTRTVTTVLPSPARTVTVGVPQVVTQVLTQIQTVTETVTQDVTHGG
jgi:Domain of unknown function (DUF6777)